MKNLKVATSVIACALLLTACSGDKPTVKDVYGKTWVPDLMHERGTIEKTLDEKTFKEFKEKVEENPEGMGIKIEENAFVDLSNPNNSRQENEGWIVEETEKNVIMTPIFDGKADEVLKMDFNGKSLCLIQERDITEIICFKEL